MQPIILPMAELKPALIGLGKVINKNAHFPALRGVKIERSREGWVTLTGTDFDCFVNARLEQPVDGEPVALVVPHADLLSTANKCDVRDAASLNMASASGVITLKYPVGNQFAEQRCESLPLGDFPPAPRVKGEPVAVSDEVRQLIREAMRCACGEPERLLLNSVFIDVSDPQCNQIVSTDGHHLFTGNSFTLPLKESIVIPDHKFLGWKGFNTDGEWQLKVGEDSGEEKKAAVQISSRRWRFIMPQREGDYPNYRRVIPAEFNTAVQLRGEALNAAIGGIERLPCDPKSRSKPICLKVEGGKLLVCGRNRGDAQFAEIEIRGAKVSGKSVTVHCNRDYALRAFQYGLGLIEIADPTSPLRFSGGGRQIIVMPARVDENPEQAAQSAQSTATVGEPLQEAQAQPASTAETEERSAMINSNTEAEPAPAKPALDLAVEQIEAVREQVRGTLINVNILIGTLKAAQREQKAAQREYSSIKTTLKTLQGLRI